MKTSKYNILFHIIGCISFFLLPLIFFPHPSDFSAILNNPPTQRDFISQLLLIIFFYLNYFHLIPKYYFSKRHAVFYSIIFLCLIFAIFLPSLLTHHKPFSQFNRRPPFNKNNFNQPPAGFRNPPPGFASPNKPPLSRDDFPFLGEASHVIFLFFVVFFFSLSLRINNRLNKVQQEETDAELSYLKSQINPHFLFNTLNLIYSLTIKKSEQASEAVVKLANMMRYVLYESNKNFVPLQNEISYIKNYIELQQSRFGDLINVSFNITGNTSSNKKIAPLILIPFVENAFKHGVNAEENSDIKIHIEITQHELTLGVFNKKVKPVTMNNNEGGVGIINTKSRLQLLYAGNYELNIEDDEKDFYVYLKLHLYD